MKIVYFALLSLFWGGSFLGINISLRGYSPFLAATLRVLLGAVLALAFIKLKKVKFPEKRITIQALLIGMIGLGVPWALLFWGEQFIAPALCSIINATSPVFTAIFASIIISSSQDRMSWNKWTGVVLGFLGIAVIFGPFIQENSLQNIWGLTALVGMAICYGVTIAWLKRISDQINIITTLFLECSGALIFLVPLSIYYGVTNYSLTGGPLLVPTLAVVYLGVFSTALALILFYKLIRDVGSVQAAAVTYLIPIVSILLDWLVLDKWVGTHAVLGAMFVFAALRLLNRPAVP